MTSKPRRFAIRFLTPLGIFLTAVVMVIAVIAFLLHHLERQDGQAGNQYFYADLERLKAGQADAMYLYCTQDTDALLSQLRGMPEVEDLNLELTDATDEGMHHVATLPKLRELVLYGGRPRVGDRGLIYLRTCINLEALTLINTDVTDHGLVALKELPNLRSLTLYRDGFRERTITDAGLVHLKSLASLRSLTLTGGWVTDAGLAHLNGIATLRSLRLEGVHVTDAGLQDLKRLTTLENLDLRGTQVTDAGVAELKRVLPEVTIDK